MSPKSRRFPSPEERFEDALIRVIGPPPKNRRFTRADLLDEITDPPEAAYVEDEAERRALLKFEPRTFVRLVKKYREAGILKICGYAKSTGGRPPALYHLDLRALNCKLEDEFTQTRLRRTIREATRTWEILPVLGSRSGYIWGSLFLRPRVRHSAASRRKDAQRARRVRELLERVGPEIIHDAAANMIVIGPIWKAAARAPRSFRGVTGLTLLQEV